MQTEQVSLAKRRLMNLLKGSVPLSCLTVLLQMRTAGMNHRFGTSSMRLRQLGQLQRVQSTARQR